MFGENAIRKYYRPYVDTNSGFNKFHNSVINMPRANFSEIHTFLKLIKSLAGYLNLLNDNFFIYGCNFKQIYIELYYLYKKDIHPAEDLRNYDFETTFFEHDEAPGLLYSDDYGYGRRFRHYMEYLSLFEIIKNYGNRNTKLIDRDAVDELLNMPDDKLEDLFRNKLLWMNISNNDFFQNLNGIKIEQYANYIPAQAIIRYCFDIGRPSTLFEVSFLLGRIDKCQTTDNILSRALAIGEELPSDVEGQKQFLFDSMGWRNPEGGIRDYRASQNPDFKFKTFILLMDSLDLISLDRSTNLIQITERSVDLLKSELPLEIVDLENLLKMIDDDTANSNELMHMIVKRRSSIITKEIQKPNSDLIVKLNKRSLREAENSPIRKRNPLIAEVAKIKANYMDEVDKKADFVGSNNESYVEAHHIIEFKKENGPDITDNLICLSASNHAIVTHGSTIEKTNFYRKCRDVDAINFDRFMNMATTYQCLTKDHVNTLLSKEIITIDEAKKLRKAISSYSR